MSDVRLQPIEVKPGHSNLTHTPCCEDPNVMLCDQRDWELIAELDEEPTCVVCRDACLTAHCPMFGTCPEGSCLP